MQAGKAPAGRMTAIKRFDNTVPSFVEAELERLYGNTYSSLLQLETYGGLDRETSTYVVQQGKAIVQILLFRIRRDRVEVLNEGLKLDSEEIARFCDYIFAEYVAANVVVFHAIETDPLHLPYPCQHFNCLEDIAMALPPTVEDYLAILGKNTRRNVKRYMERLIKTFPSFQFETFERNAIHERDVRAVIDCNRSRMAAKQKVSDIDETETRRIVRMARACGMVGVVSIDGNVCGGTISYRTGDNYFLYVLAHNPQYDGYWIGILSCYLTICECIERGGKEFHFLWGRYDYKFTLGASQRNLDHITIYRSRLQFLLNMKTAMGDAYHGYKRRTVVWLRYDVMEKSKLASALVRHVLRTVRPVAG